MSNIAVTGDERVSATFRFPSDFIGFRGHFPNGAVLPGVCKIQAVLVLCETLKAAPAQLHEVITAKFFAPAARGDELSFDVVQSSCAADRYLVKAHVSRRGERIARIDLLVGYGA